MKEFGFRYIGYNSLNNFMLRDVMVNILSYNDTEIVLNTNRGEFHYFQKDKLHVLIDFKTIELSLNNEIGSKKSHKGFIRMIESSDICQDTFLLIMDSRLDNVKINPSNGIFLNITGSVIENSCIRFVKNYNKGSRYFIVNSTIKSDLVLSNSSYTELRQCNIECMLFRIIFPSRMLYFKDISVYSPGNEFIYNSKYARYYKSTAFKLNYDSSNGEKVVYIDNTFPDGEKVNERSEIVQFLGKSGYDTYIFNTEFDSIYLLIKPKKLDGKIFYTEFLYTTLDCLNSIRLIANEFNNRLMDLSFINNRPFLFKLSYLIKKLNIGIRPNKISIYSSELIDMLSFLYLNGPMLEYSDEEMRDIKTVKKQLKSFYKTYVGSRKMVGYIGGLCKVRK